MVGDSEACLPFLLQPTIFSTSLAEEGGGPGRYRKVRLEMQIPHLATVDT